MAKIDEHLLKHLFALAKIEEEKSPARRKKLLSDLGKILDYFNELREVSTDGVEPLAGGTFLTNIFRKDGEKNLSDEERKNQREKSTEQFPRKENKFLKTPPVF
ncbi:MAG: Aspartyl/glutamyl-tRNA(Asn/Gln) amidotransferase subunit C [Candidatus Wolfebacteria bacterium GW2011_GWC1_43_10]|uniref:Aspartyl/glutamyl-tRNA(Asn/Gln) amidotransferase subunit C n=2 Tax=Candidatus Wolfeibacteriota TaxID=1752735 RepID=A0A0G1CBK7_9BACT|nr:MAG: Aspartyl/glutamyl-tRNA(Asn/Gln) amidotransferase subunit C [Candidatus Wolfebacteria bacterium GW2011_GWC1_43_10]KKT22429.1 MAG: Aspartyl/glutamyl-tRNA(Asn/Gln) amidotransferase subunit C [Parcubacteria group bacterium GW2011_GWB1_43_8b]OGM89346.1 MAG: hypothetical protein A2108_00830 [Candidatus Wolfebacteria bacterium GWA1_42_9]